MTDRLQELLAQWNRFGGKGDSASDVALDWLQTADEDSVSVVLRSIVTDDRGIDRPKWPLWQHIVVQLVRRQRAVSTTLSDADRSRIAVCYRQLDEACPARCMLLCLLTAEGSSSSLALFADLIVECPPGDVRPALEPFGDLFRADARSIESLFPRLLDGLENPCIAGLILDFCNYAMRKQLLASHPARARRSQLRALLGGVADRLGQLQEQPPTTQEELTTQGRQVNESVAIAVSLCDALSLIGDPIAIGALRKTMELEHRRLRVEAAAALARLGEEAGKQQLIQMAAEPSERLRVLAYADELEISDRIPPEHATPTARAEAELASWLSDPTQFGIPPSHIELLAERTQFWPGFDGPVACFLFRFEYPFPQDAYANIGIAGPVVCSMQPDLTGLSVEDLFAVFAGWHVEHPDVNVVDAGRLAGQEQFELHRLERTLQDAGLADVRPQLFGTCFGQRVLVAFATRDHRSGIAIADSESHDFFPQGPSQRPLGPMEAFYLYVGRNLLASFNRLSAFTKAAARFTLKRN